MLDLRVIFRNETLKVEFKDWLENSYYTFDEVKYGDMNNEQRIQVILKFIKLKGQLHLVKEVEFKENRIHHNLKLVGVLGTKLVTFCEASNVIEHDAYVELLTNYSNKTKK